MELGDYLRKLRERSKLTALQVHEYTSIPMITIYHYEVGRRAPSAERIEILAKLYSVSPRPLLALAGHCPEEYQKVQKEMARNVLNAELARAVIEQI